MARRISPFKLGLFMLIGGTLALATVIWLGISHYFEEREIYVSYFDESVKGLQQDAVINYRGVAVGRVADIGVAPDSRLIEVLLHLKPDFEVGASLAIQLREQGLTGLRYLEIDTAPEDIDKLTPKITFTPPYPVIASQPSEMQQLKQALESIYEKIEALDLSNLANNWTKTADMINRVLGQVEGAFEPSDWKAMVHAVRQTAEDSSTFMGNLAKATSQQNMKEGFQDLAATLEASRQASESLARQMKGFPPDAFATMMKRWDQTLGTGGSMISNLDKQLVESNALLQQSLQQFKVLLTQLSSLVQSLKERPNQLLFPANEPDPFNRRR